MRYQLKFLSLNEAVSFLDRQPDVEDPQNELLTALQDGTLVASAKRIAAWDYHHSEYSPNSEQFDSSVSKSYWRDSSAAIDWENNELASTSKQHAGRPDRKVKAHNIYLARTDIVNIWQLERRAHLKVVPHPATPETSPTKHLGTTIGAETKCTKWLSNLMASGPKELTKPNYKEEANMKFGVGKKAFDRSWGNAAEQTGDPYGWSHKGRPRKTPPQ